MKKEDYIRALLDKYMDGLTSAGEEEALRGYFSNPKNAVPDEWKPYKALFAYVCSEREKQPEALAAKPKTRHKAWLYAASVAACAALLLAVALPKMRPADDYVVVDGKVYTNQETVQKEALEALQMVSADEDDSFGALEMIRK